jgi:hypothetical protein
MDEQPFRSEIRRARTFREMGERPAYWCGYERGLRRGVNGEEFGTDQEHELWLTLAADGSDPMCRARGQGFRDWLIVATAETTA